MTLVKQYVLAPPVDPAAATHPVDAATNKLLYSTLFNTRLPGQELQ